MCILRISGKEVNQKKFPIKGNFQHLSNYPLKLTHKADSTEKNILADGETEFTLCEFIIIYDLLGCLASLIESIFLVYFFPLKKIHKNTVLACL